MSRENTTEEKELGTCECCRRQLATEIQNRNDCGIIIEYEVCESCASLSTKRFFEKFMESI